MIVALLQGSLAEDEGIREGSRSTNETPIINITSPVEGSTVGEVFIVEGTFSPIQSHTMWVRVNNQEWQMADGSSHDWFAIVYIPDVPDGMITISAHALLERGLESSTPSISVFLDRSYTPGNERPEVHLISPTEDPSDYFEFSINGTTEDDGEEIVTYYTSMGFEWQVLSREWQWKRRVSVDWMIPGHYQIEIFAYDGERTSEVVTVNFTVLEYIPATIDILNPVNGTRFSKDLNVSGEITGSGTPVREVMVSINGGEWVKAEGGRQWYYLLSTESLEPGLVVIEVEADVEYEGWLDAVNVTAIYQLATPSPSGESSWIFASVIILIVVLSVTGVLIYKRKHSSE
jgi:hypothetical protein